MQKIDNRIVEGLPCSMLSPRLATRGKVARAMVLMVCLLAIAWLPAQGQRIKLKLTYTGTDAYMGTMDPKWFEVVSLKLPMADAAALVGAEGMMEGGSHGAMGFRVEKNLLPTDNYLMLRTSNGWYPVERIKQKGDKLRLVFDWGYRPAVQPEDLEILREARALLDDASAWHQEDDRDCADDMEEERYSLYCAMMEASYRVTKDFNHRGAALNLVRAGIGDLRPDREYAHRLMDFNNEEALATIQALLDGEIVKLENELAAQ